MGTLEKLQSDSETITLWSDHIIFYFYAKTLGLKVAKLFRILIDFTFLHSLCSTHFVCFFFFVSFTDHTKYNIMLLKYKVTKQKHAAKFQTNNIRKNVH